MRKIIDGKKYDSEKARKVGTWTNNFKGSDHMESTLYRKRTGEYFIMKTTGETEADLGFRKDIIPVSIEEARRWGLDHLDSKSFDREFVNKKDGGTVPVTLNLPKWVYTEVKNNATVRGSSMASEVTRMVKNLSRVSVDRILCSLDFGCEWRVVNEDGDLLFTSNTTEHERQVAAHGLLARGIDCEDGKIVVRASNTRSNYLGDV